MSDLSTIKIIIIVVIAILTLSFFAVVAYYRSLDCPNDAFAISGNCYLKQPIYTCINTTTPDASGNNTFIIANVNTDYGCMANPNGSNSCLTYPNKAACDTALNNTSVTAVPNIQMTPTIQPRGNNPGMIMCTQQDYANPASFCNYLLSRFATTT